VAALMTPWPRAAAEWRSDVQARRQAEEERLRKIRAEIDDLRGRLEGLQSREGSVLDALEELDLTLALLGREADSLRQERAMALRREAGTRRDAEEIGRRIALAERSLGRWLREVYKVGPARYLKIVAASGSPAQIASGHRAVEAMSLGEARRIERYRADREAFDRTLADLAAQRLDLDRLGAALQRKDREVRDSRERKSGVLAAVKREQAAQKRALIDLVQMEKEIQALLEALDRRRTGEIVPSLGFARFRGLLEWPAEGRVAVPFGNVRHPRFSTQVPHPGVDIAAPRGHAVRAVFDGRVVFSSWFRGYGQMIVLDHGDGYLSIYGQLEERLKEAGAEVRQGEAIARSGQGGAFDAPGLYFEIRHDGRPEDPMQWLRGSPGRGVPDRPQARSRGRAARPGAP
jgi:septal ring factor EnvC (AmiA/AmiB activator)